MKSMHSRCSRDTLKVTGMFPGSQTHITFMAYYNVPVESKTVKFDIIVHLRDSTFTPAAMQSQQLTSSRKFPLRKPTARDFMRRHFLRK